MKSLSASLLVAAAAMAVSLAGPLACDSGSDPQSYGDSSPNAPADGGAPDDSNTPTQNANIGVGVDVNAQVVLDIDYTALPANAEMQATATLGRPLVVRVSYLGATSPWEVSAPAVHGDAAVVTSQQVAGQLVSTSTETFSTSGLAPGVVDITATFHGQVAGVTTSATVTVHVTLAAAVG